VHRRRRHRRHLRGRLARAAPLDGVEHAEPATRGEGAARRARRSAGASACARRRPRRQARGRARGAAIQTVFPRHWLDDRNLRYREAIIEVGETIAVVGSGVREPDPDAMPEGAYRDAQRTCLRMTSSRKQPMIISDGKKATE
jgi:hypothetical protein